jgi:putative ABC transport system substrate-binding protein
MRVTRRSLLMSLGALAALLLSTPAHAQPPGKVYRIGFLWDTPDVWPHAIAGFRAGLRDLGWIEGRNVVIEYRWAQGHYDRIPAMAEDLARSKVDVIVAPTSIYTAAAKRATSTIPIVFMSHADPIGSGHVQGLAHPGTNATGLTIVMTDTMAKSVELLKSMLPGLTRLGVVVDPATPSHTPTLQSVEASGRTLGLRVHVARVKGVQEFDEAFAALAHERVNAVLVLSTPLFMGGAGRLAELGLSHKLPTMFGAREHVAAGGLAAYSPDRADLYRRGASYVDKIFKGANAANLPVQQATKFDFVVNLKTARALGLTIPTAVLTRADEIIE